MPKSSAAMVLLLPVVLAACSSADEDTSQNDRPLVVTTFSILADITEEIGGEHIEVRSITPVGAEVHEYDPTPSDIQAVADADLVIENGLGLEAWFEQFIAHSEAATVTASAGVDTRAITRLPGHPEDPAETDELPIDPHGWISPVQAISYVDTIEDALAELDAENAEHFAENADTYRAELEEITSHAQQRAAELNSPALVSCEGAFGYLAQDLGLDEHYLWPLNAEDEGTPQQAEAQIQFVESHDVETIFCESTVNDSAQRQVAETTGAELAGPLHVDSLTDSDGPAPTHLALLEHTIDTVLEQAE